MQQGERMYSDDKRLVVFLTGMEKPPTSCHLANVFHISELGLQLCMGVHILTSVPRPHGPGTPAAWLI